MSEYQYYEFLAIDRALDRSEMAALRAMSTRAEITPTRFANTYNWGNLKGSPSEMMKKYFDAHVYVANWGTRHFMLRLPKTTVDEDTLFAYGSDEVLECWTAGEHLFVSWERNEEPDDDWVEGEGWMARLAPIRDELERGDYRALYLGWLYGAGTGAIPEDDCEPPLPAGLRSLTAAQHSLVEFLGIDDDLLAAAASGSPAPDQAASLPELSEWVASVPADEARGYLLLLLQGQSKQAERELRRQYTLSLRSGARSAPAQRARSVAELFKLAEAACGERLEREEKERQRELAERRQQRERYLGTLATDFGRYWRQADELAEQGGASAYDRARGLLVDLADAYALQQKGDEFQQRLSQFRMAHARRNALMRRLDEARLVTGV